MTGNGTKNPWWTELVGEKFAPMIIIVGLLYIGFRVWEAENDRRMEIERRQVAAREEHNQLLIRHLDHQRDTLAELVETLRDLERHDDTFLGHLGTMSNAVERIASHLVD